MITSAHDRQTIVNLFTLLTAREAKYSIKTDDFQYKLRNNGIDRITNQTKDLTRCKDLSNCAAHYCGNIIKNNNSKSNPK